MDSLATLITDTLNSLLPVGTSNFNDWVSFNETLGILLSYGFMWKFLVKPFVNLFNFKK